MRVILRIIRYIQLHLLRDPLYFVTYSFSYFLPSYVPQITFFDSQAVSLQVAEGKSLIRLGDGEIYLLNHGDIIFAKSTPTLRDLLRRMISEYDDKSSYILALNKIPLLKTNRELKKKNVLNCWLPSKVFYNLYFNKKSKYADAAMFYFKETIPKYFETYLKDRQLIFVSNAKYIESFKSNTAIPFKTISYLEVPESGAQEKYEVIKKNILDMVERLDKNKVTVLVSFGPVAKVMAFELSKMGIQVLDIGQGITAAYSTVDHSLSKNISVLE